MIASPHFVSFHTVQEKLRMDFELVASPYFVSFRWVKFIEDEHDNFFSQIRLFQCKGKKKIKIVLLFVSLCSEKN